MLFYASMATWTAPGVYGSLGSVSIAVEGAAFRNGTSDKLTCTKLPDCRLHGTFRSAMRNFPLPISSADLKVMVTASGYSGRRFLHSRCRG